jgi:hypothetical protein
MRTTEYGMFTTAELQQKLKNQNWTAHNIRLNPEVTTIPGQPDFAETDERLKAILRVLRLLHDEDLTSLRIADLGCLEGGFAWALARRGASVLGIEARAANLSKALLLKEHFQLDRLEFIQEDAKAFSFERFGSFDVVLALGILYHLDSPVEWLSQIAGATQHLIVDTHFAPATGEALALIDPRISNLSEIIQIRHGQHDYEGRWFTEYGEDVDPEPQLWASYSNHRSFWLTKESLLVAMCRAGFDLVFEQHDYSAYSYRHFEQVFPRTLLVGLKQSVGRK